MQYRLNIVPKILSLKLGDQSAPNVGRTLVDKRKEGPQLWLRQLQNPPTPSRGR